MAYTRGGFYSQKSKYDYELNVIIPITLVQHNNIMRNDFHLGRYFD